MSGADGRSPFMKKFSWGNGYGGFQLRGEGFSLEPDRLRERAAKNVAKMPFRVVKDGVVLAGNVDKIIAQRFADQVGGTVVS